MNQETPVDVRELVGKWRGDAAFYERGGDPDKSVAYTRCADELEAALTQPAGEAVAAEWQCRELDQPNGRWHNIDQSYYEDHHNDPRWLTLFEYRVLYTHPSPEPAVVEALRDLEVCVNTVDGCYTRNPGNFAVALRELRDSATRARTALAANGGQP